ncbi:MAG: hypothetical protein LBT87_02730 [Treponema sp.]|jgi:outer membrane murein-binding lipoprotein Lpp|nr:hypothetical protein [Treponema sp.]
MKKKNCFIAAAGMAVLVMAGCASNPKPEAAPTAAEIRREQDAGAVDTQPRPSTVLDWANRNLGEDPVPLWLKPLIKGNSGPVKSAYGVSSDARVKYSIARRANRDEARVQAGLLFAAQTANELKTYVMSAAAQTLNEGQIDIIEEITTATKVNITGMERVADFWHLVETEDPATRVKSREYLYYVVWAMPQAAWTALTRKYVNDVIGQVPDRQVQINVAGAYGDIQARADREAEMGDAEFRQKLRLQEQAARDAQERELARINQRTVAAAAAQTAQTQAAADAVARYAAYRSGDPAVAATTAADYDWISALSAASDVVFD